jgi:hypothetical protein
VLVIKIDVGAHLARSYRAEVSLAARFSAGAPQRRYFPGTVWYHLSHATASPLGREPVFVVSQRLGHAPPLVTLTV